MEVLRTGTQKRRKSASPRFIKITKGREGANNIKHMRVKRKKERFFSQTAKKGKVAQGLVEKKRPRFARAKRAVVKKGRKTKRCRRKEPEVERERKKREERLVV